MGEVNAHEKINIYTYSEVESVGGFVGEFQSRYPQKSKIRRYGQMYRMWSLPGEMSI